MKNSRSWTAHNWGPDPISQTLFEELRGRTVPSKKKAPPGPGGSGKVIDVKPVSVEREPEEMFICVQTFASKKAIIRMFDNEDPKVVLRERGLQDLKFRDATDEEIAAWRKANS